MPGLESERPDDYLTRLARSDLGRASKTLVLKALQIRPGDVVVDLGCGPGADLCRFADAVGPSGRVLGFDSDPSAVTEADHKTAGRGQVAVALGDIHHLALPGGSADRVHTDRVLQHVADPMAVVREAARVLCPGGLVAFAEPDWDTLVIDDAGPTIAVVYRRFVTERVVRNSRIGRRVPALCETNGLTRIEVVPVTAVFRDVQEADRVLGLHRVTARAVRAGHLTDRDGSDWLARLQSGPFFASVTLFVTSAAKPLD